MTWFGKLKSNKGFTLVEVIISIGFLCVACVIIIQLFIASGEVRGQAANKEMASIRASNAIEACKISNMPENIGIDIFNQEFTDYEIADDGVIIREYFGEDWTEPLDDIMPVYVVKTIVTRVNENPVTAAGFGTVSAGKSILVSELYEIHVTAGYVDTDRNPENMLAEYLTMKHYVYREDPE